MHAWEKLDKAESLRKNAVKLVVRQTNINDEGKKIQISALKLLLMYI